MCVTTTPRGVYVRGRTGPADEIAAGSVRVVLALPSPKAAPGQSDQVFEEVEMTVAGRETMTVAYTTAACSRHERVNGGYVLVLAGVMHAKTWGEAKALCGADSATWPKL